MKKTKIVICIILYLVFWPLTYSAILADYQAESYDEKSAQRHCRKDMGTAMAFALIPLWWPLVPFLTGFYEHGLKFGCFEEKRS